MKIFHIGKKINGQYIQSSKKSKNENNKNEFRKSDFYCTSIKNYKNKVLNFFLLNVKLTLLILSPTHCENAWPFLIYDRHLPYSFSGVEGFEPPNDETKTRSLTT